MSPVTVDSAALEAAASLAEEALACHREALILIAEGWQSETGSAIADFMDRQCVHGADVVEALRRASGGTNTAPDTWSDPGSEPVHPVDPVALPPDPATGGGDPITPTPPPTPVSPTVPAPPWTGPAAADASWAAPSSGGLPQMPALPDLGGTLVGLVAEIAQALGSYADVAPSADAPWVTADEGADAPPDPAKPATEPVSQDGAPTARLTDSPPVPGTAAGPVGAPVSLPLPPTPEPIPPAPPELLAAERPPDSAPAAGPAPIADAPAAAVPETPVPDTGPPPATVPAEKTPCEIAADELAKVGE